MTSFLANTTAYVAHQPETVCAVLATNRSIMNSSVVPVILSSDELWDALCSRPFMALKTENFLRIFVTFSDTMQFAEKLRIIRSNLDRTNTAVLTQLIETKRYFNSTVKHIILPSVENIALCCKNLRNVRTIDLRMCSNNNNELSDDVFKLIFTSFTLLEKLEMPAVDNRYISSGLEWISRLTCLKELTLPLTNANNGFRLLQCLPKSLRVLDIGHCFTLMDSAFADDFLEEDAQNKKSNKNFDEPRLPNLTTIHLQFTRISEVSYQQLQKHAPNLTSLTANRRLDAEGIKYVAQMTSLRTLIFAPQSQAPLDEDSLKLLCTNLRCLEVLDIDNRAINDRSLQHISELSCTSIRKMRIKTGGINDDVPFTDDGFRYFFDSMKYLESLDIDQNYNENFTGFIGEDNDGNNNNNNNLRHLHFSQCAFLSDRGLKSILSKSPFLTSLTIQWGGDEITSAGLKSAFESSTGCKSSLVHLDLNNLKGITDLGFLRELLALKKLDLTGDVCDFRSIRRDTRNGFKCLEFPPLEELILNSTTIEDDDIACFPPKLIDNLKVLELNCCSNLTDKVLIESISKMLSLETLNIGSLGPGKCKFSIAAIQHHVVEKLGHRYLEIIIVPNNMLNEIRNNEELKAKIGFAIGGCQ